MLNDANVKSLFQALRDLETEYRNRNPKEGKYAHFGSWGKWPGFGSNVRVAECVEAILCQIAMNTGTPLVINRKHKVNIYGVSGQVCSIDSKALPEIITQLAQIAAEKE